MSSLRHTLKLRLPQPNLSILLRFSDKKNMSNNNKNTPVRAVDRRFTTTAFTFPGYTIAQNHGVVRGLTVRTPNVGKSVFGAFASLGGGESTTYIEMAEKARETAFVRLLEHAAASGGNAVLGVKFTGQELLEGMTEILAYGTSVTLVPQQQPQHGNQQESKAAAAMADPYEENSMPREPVTGKKSDNSTKTHHSEGSQMNDLESISTTETDYYGVLNISRTASDTDIKDAYRRLSRVLHPDMQNEKSLKASAETKFRLVSRAYEVLNNPQLRAAYDEYGEAGLNTKWEVGHRVKTPQETMDDYARLASERNQLELENLIRSRNDITINIDASRVFGYYQPISPFRTSKPVKKGRVASVLDTLGRTEIMQLYMKNSFETQFGPNTKLILGGSMASQSGTGRANLVGTLRHTFNETVSMELGTSLLEPKASIIKGTYNFDPSTFVAGTAHLRGFHGPTPLVMTFGRRITKGATGYMTYRTGEWAIGSWGPAFEHREEYSSMALGFMSTDVNETYQIELKAGVMQSHLSADRTWPLDESTRIRVGTILSSTAGLSASIGGDRKITEHTKLGLAVEIGLTGGIAFNIKVNRLGQSVTVPIMLSSEFKPRFAFWTAVAPICAIAALDLGYIKPKRRRERAERLKEHRKIHAEFIANQMKEAEEAIHLLRDSTARKTKQEQDKDGLVIIEAVYGNLNAGLVADVTIPIQALVDNSQLIMPGGHSKNHILGFYDPCLGEKKQLRIRYEFQKRMHEAVVADEAHVTLPIRSHMIPS
ncbi:hypothetical protein BG011_007584 [Mortierella polycephala]|uniref:J domain-containing protein n=1 Tax=Mortierella polycephala TaxID=41804 RepID=A0A9P6PT17_9FUNG|nr:hypothetical protein BG011_007584 [Mortierella polycephala]